MKYRSVFHALAIMTLLVTLLALAVPVAETTAGTAAITAVGLGAGPLGMAGAQVAVIDDVNAVFYNPAGLAALDTRQVSSMYSRRFDVLTTYGVGFAANGFGFAFIGNGSEGIPKTDEFGNPTGDHFGVSERLLIASYARSLGSIDAGVSAKYFYHDLHVASGTGLTMDAGLRWRGEGQPLQMGLVVRNLSGSVQYSTGKVEPFERVIVVGAGWQQAPWRVALDKELPGALRLGVSYEAGDKIGLRAGLRYEEELTVTAGFGISVDSFKVEYAYEQPPVLDGTHWFSVGMHF